MKCSKFFSITLTAFCGLAIQFQVSGVNAQTQTTAANADSVTLLPGRHLTPGMGLRSPNGHSLVLKQDGNVVFYNSKRAAILSTNTKGYEPVLLIMKMDGNLVLYSTNGQVWASNTSGNPGAFLAIQDDGNLVIHRSGSQTQTSLNALWASGTSGR
jgi:hypothetical protein